MKPPNPRIVTINGRSSSVKFALFEAGDSLRRKVSYRSLSSCVRTGFSGWSSASSTPSTASASYG
jgi:hypothetical protein